MTSPLGCLACNREEITAGLELAGIDPARFIEVPPGGRWDEELVCYSCGRVWVLRPMTEEEENEMLERAEEAWMR